MLRASVTGAVSDSGAHSDRAPRTVRPQQIGLEHYRPACCSAMYLEVCWKGYEWKFASHHRTEKSDGLASMRDSCADGSTWIVSDGGPRSATCGGTSISEEGERRKWVEEGCLDTPLRKGSGT